MITTVLYPSLQAERIRSSVVGYLSTTFALTDAESRRALADFLEDPERGVFVFTGPFVRLRNQVASGCRAVGPLHVNKYSLSRRTSQSSIRLFLDLIDIRARSRQTPLFTSASF